MTNHFLNLRRHVPDIQNRRILDLGCGRGEFILEAAEGGARVVGVDINEKYLELTRKRTEGDPRVEKILKSSGESLPFLDSSFGFVNMAEVIEHVADPQHVLDEVFRVLEPSGCAYISVPSRFGIRDPHFHLYFVNLLPRAWAERVIDMCGRTKNYEDTSAGRQRLSDMHYYTFNAAKNLFTRKGFCVRDIRIERIEMAVWKPLHRISVLLYGIIRPFYPVTFHFLVTKPPCEK